MSFNGSGTFNINTAGQPVVTGTVISSSVFNALTADLATGLSTCITKDGQTTVTANIPMNSFKFTGLAAGTAATDSVRLGQLQAGAATLITVTGTNTYAGTMTPALSAYAAGNTFTFLVPNTNTTSCTLNIDGLGAKSITRDGTTALVAGDLVANSEVVVVYDGTQFQVLNSNSKTNFNLSGTLTVAGNTTLSGGTANGVAYLNGSKVLTTGSGFTFASSVLTIDGGTGVSSKVRFGQSGIVNWDIQNTASTGVLDITNGAGSAFKSESVNASVIGLYVAAAGNVGIGTTSPTSKLSISGGLDFKSYIAHADNFALYANSTDGTTLAAYTGYPITFRIGNSEKMRLDSSGNLLVGTTTATSKFVVSSSGDTLATIVGGAANAKGVSFYDASTNGAQIYSVSSDLRFFTVATGSSTERMRLDSSGNLGLGVTPSGWDNNFKAFQLGYPNFIAGNNGGNRLDIGVNAYFSTNYKYANTAAATYYSQASGSHAWFNAPSGTAGNAISFTQAMTLDSSGNLLVGTTSSYGGPGRINVGFNQSSNFGITLRNTSATATGVFVSFENSGGTGNGSISQTNSTTVAYNTSSDRRLKKNIAPAPQAGTDIDAIEIVSHGWVSNDDTVKYGVVAQDIQSIVPQAVTAGDEGDEIERVWGVDYSKLVPMLIKEIQSLRQRVAQLEVK